jgi:sugar/nucleoside kinase (ribokinase family)
VTNCTLIVGSMAFDDLELPSGSYHDVVGGAATYASLAASLYAEAKIVAVVGNDFPEAWLDRLSSRHIDISGIERASGKTFRWHGEYAADLSSRKTLATELNVFADFNPKLPASYRESSHVLLGNIHPELQLRVLEQIVKPKFVAADTMNYWIEGERPQLLKVISRIHTLLINDEEARLLGEDHNIARAARRIRAMGPKALVVKRGDAGALLFDDEGTFFCPALPLDSELDPTGAGDTFAGALLGQLAAAGEVGPRQLRVAIRAAAAAASFCVEGVGPERLLAVTRQEVDGRRDMIAKLSQC